MLHILQGTSSNYVRNVGNRSDSEFLTEIISKIVL